MSFLAYESRLAESREIKQRLPFRKCYLHSYGFDQAFGRYESALGTDFSAGFDHAEEVLQTHRDLVNPAGFLTSVLWGDNNVKVVEVFGYGHVDKWPGNPEIYSWVFRDGIHQPELRQISCGETLHILGREEAVRQKSISPFDFALTNPYDDKEIADLIKFRPTGAVLFPQRYKPFEQSHPKMPRRLQ